jgi:hypothetical protein
MARVCVRLWVWCIFFIMAVGFTCFGFRVSGLASLSSLRSVALRAFVEFLVSGFWFLVQRDEGEAGGVMNYEL